MIIRINSQILIFLLLTSLSALNCYANQYGEGCEGDCPVESYCGNGEVDLGEECDSTEDCNYNCQFIRCGNGIIEEGNGEQCEPVLSQCFESNCYFREQQGQNNVTTCSLDCQLQTCGNEIIEGDEDCDFGDNEIGDGCGATCLLEECGNAILDIGEQCDDGNLSSADGCSNECKIETECFGDNCGPQAEVFDCLDKEGNFNKLDRCQVCGGDGMSCLDCVESSNVADQLKMDGAAKRMAGLITAINKKILLLDINNQLKKSINTSNQQVQDLYLSGWTFAWALPPVTKACNTVFCSTADLSGIVIEYANKLDELHFHAKKSARIFKRLTGKKYSAKKFLEKVNQQYISGIETSRLVTTSTSVCS